MTNLTEQDYLIAKLKGELPVEVFAQYGFDWRSMGIADHYELHRSPWHRTRELTLAEWKARKEQEQ